MFKTGVQAWFSSLVLKPGIRAKCSSLVFKPGVQACFLDSRQTQQAYFFRRPLYMLAACFWPSSMKLLELRFKAGEFILESRMYLT